MYKGVQNNIIIHQPDLLRKIRNTSITLQKTVSFSYLCVMKKILTDTQYIHKLVAEGEHEHQDFKFEISDARKIARSISAFANTGGGRLLVGVKDNGKIAGIRHNAFTVGQRVLLAVAVDLQKHHTVAADALHDEALAAEQTGAEPLMEVDGQQICLFVDSLVGKQEIVVKPIPSYVKKVKGLSGCTQLGDGSIALILDVGALTK